MLAYRVVKVQPHEFLPSELDKCEWPASGPSHFKAGESANSHITGGGEGLEGQSQSGYYTTTLCKCAIQIYHTYSFNLCQEVVVHAI